MAAHGKRSVTPPLMFRPKPDRRDVTSREQLLRRAQLALCGRSPKGIDVTRMKELLRLRGDICTRVLGALVQRGTLAEKPGGQYTLSTRPAAAKLRLRLRRPGLTA
jgi:hypothetical protein